MIKSIRRPGGKFQPGGAVPGVSRRRYPHYYGCVMNSFQLEKKKALVCGGSRGIGKASAIELARQGAEVILLARDPGVLEQAKAELPSDSGQKHRVIAVDAADLTALKESVTQAVGESGPIHILLNNSGGPPPGPVLDAVWEAFFPAFYQHLGSAHVLAQLLIPGMKKEGYGRIINIISTSVKQPISGLGVSNTVRGAMASWSKTLASEVAAHGVTVNNVLPGATRTGRLTSLLESLSRKQNLPVAEIEAQWLASIPAGRFGEPEDVGRAVAFLASPAAGYINGINLPVDGGRTSCL